MSGVKDLIIRTLDEELADFDIVVDRTADHKRTLAHVTMQAVSKVDLDALNVDDPKSVEAFAKLTNAALKAVDAQETTSMRRVNAKLKLAESRRSDDVSEAVTALLSKMDTGDFTDNEVTTTLESDEQAVDARYTAEGMAEILEGELRADPKDLEER